MSFHFEEGKEPIINLVIKKIQQNMAADQAALCAEFLRQFYGTMSLEDLEERDVDDLYGSAVNFWSLLQQRAANETKIRIYNPDFEHHGWQTTHTVVEVLCKDMPFLVDSMSMVMHRLGIACHLVVHMGGIRLARDKNNRIQQIFPKFGDLEQGSFEIEAPILFEIDRQTDPAILDTLYQQFERVLEDVRVVVEDWIPMRERVRSIIDELDTVADKLDQDELAESKAFIKWIEDHHFTFLGVRDYELVEKGKEMVLQALPETGLGVLRPGLAKSSSRSITGMSPEARAMTLSSRILLVSKTNTLASVHRDAFTDYIGVKRFNHKGQVIGERRIIGLYTSAAYNTSPKYIPFLRHKVASIMQQSMLSPKSHAGKVLLNILETLPRDDLIQGTDEELLRISMGIFQMQDRRKIRLFARIDPYHRFISCYVFVPRERFNTELREQMQVELAQSFHSDSISFSTRFSESVLARIHFIVRINPKEKQDYDFKAVEKRLIEIGRNWTDDLQQNLLDSYGEEEANTLFNRYKNAFSTVYMASFTARAALVDIKHIEALVDAESLGMNFYGAVDEPLGNYRLKIYQKDSTIALSDVLPILENLGMRAISERPYRLQFEDGSQAWVNEFALQYKHEKAFDFEKLRDVFQEAFASLWFEKAENDGFNQLVLLAGLDWRQISVLRAYAKYFKQIGFTFSQDYIVAALNHQSAIAQKIAGLFALRFDPKDNPNRDNEVKALEESILADLNAVENLDEDKIIRQYLHVLQASLRTNFYQSNQGNVAKSYLSFKLRPSSIPGVPRPHPMFEIFVYSPRFEGVHLRGGPVSRGGIRWSDRPEDFRTEILDLVRAQTVKNAVIVPGGAKGGFVPKQMPANASREVIQAEAVACYQLFIRGLLDLTDNYKEGKLQKPSKLFCYDKDDPYLVVAADKGTASFSDIANAISAEYDFWLGDAFASGGSMGYDHKKMGITAKGAWESVKRHFLDMGLDVSKNNFTVVGIGDLAGDVFGNGMLLSKHIKLIAAFNHMHIFVDPNPDPKTSFVERQRMFNLPRSSWSDYDSSLISKGGGIFSRAAKWVDISPEMQLCFGITEERLEPNELIRTILKSEFDLLWNGGIGTFVKAESESHVEVGDRSNDAIRVNANELQCRVVGEGGNLGFTQKARIEYALQGGRNFTDFIDNSGGVSCSDKEVNIKILLNAVVAAGDLTMKQRNSLLAEMQDEVAIQVLRENYSQTRAINLMMMQAVRSMLVHSRYIDELERSGKINREFEDLPSEKTLLQRKQEGKGLTRPEFAVLFCYSKILLKAAILDSDVPEEPYVQQFLVANFPKPLQESYAKPMQQHSLKREIIATKISNLIVNEMGFTFIYRMQDETGASVASIVRAYMIARAMFNVEQVWAQIEQLDGRVDNTALSDMMMLYVRLLRRITRWFLRNRSTQLNLQKTIEEYAPGVAELKQAMPAVFGPSNRGMYKEFSEQYRKLGVTEKLAHDFTVTRGLFASMDIIDLAHELSIPVPQLAEVYFGVSEALDIAWLRTQVIIHPSENHWEALSREALRDDLDWQQRHLTSAVIRLAANKKDLKQAIPYWVSRNRDLIERWKGVIGNLRSSSGLNYTVFFVAVRELLFLTQSTLQMLELEQGK